MQDPPIDSLTLQEQVTCRLDVAVEACAIALSASQQHTLGSSFERVGVGLHSGATVRVRVSPAATGQGRFFVRADLPGCPRIAANPASVRETTLSTELATGDATVRTVEHLLAALAGMGVDNAEIVLDGPEVPLLDGSAQDWVMAIAQAGVVPQEAPRIARTLMEPISVQHQDAFVAAFPASQLRFTYGIDFDLPAIGNQWYSWSPQQESFAAAIAPARTFGLAHQIDQLRAMGLIRGGSLDNALVCSREGWLNPPLRFSNEPVRHKLLDLVGDFSLIGTFPPVHILAYRASHQLHTQLTQRLTQVLAPPGAAENSLF